MLVALFTFLGVGLVLAPQAAAFPGYTKTSQCTAYDRVDGLFQGEAIKLRVTWETKVGDANSVRPRTVAIDFTNPVIPARVPYNRYAPITYFQNSLEWWVGEDIFYIPINKRTTAFYSGTASVDAYNLDSRLRAWRYAPNLSTWVHMIYDTNGVKGWDCYNYA